MIVTVNLSMHKGLFRVSKTVTLFFLFGLVLLGQDIYASEQALKRADVLFNSKKYQEARALYRDVFLRAKKGPLAETALLGVAKSDYKLRLYYEARQNLNRVLAMSQDPAIINETNYYLGLVALSLYNYRLADRHLATVTGQLKVPATIGMAEAALRLNEVSRAEVLLKTLRNLDIETNPRGLAVRAMLDSLKGRHERAVNTISRIDEKILKEMDMTIEKAQILFYANKLKDAEGYLNRILSSPDLTNINRMRAYRVLWQLYNKEDRIDDAIKVGNALLAYEHSDDFKIRLANLYDKKNDMSNALRVLSYVESKRLKEREVEKRLRQVLAKKDPSATKYINRYSNFVSIDSPLLVDIARHLVAENDKKRAIELLKRASRGASAGAASLYMAELLLEENRLTEAKRALDYLSLDPRYVKQASVLMGKIIEREGNVEKVLEYYKKIYEISKDAKIAERIGDILWGQNKRDEAGRYYMLSAAGGNLTAAVKAGDYLYLTGNKKAAIDYYRKAIGIPKEQPEYLWLNYQYGKLTGNKEYLKRAASGSGEIAEAAKVLLKEF